jgi:hypothetical protein
MSQCLITAGGSVQGVKDAGALDCLSYGNEAFVLLTPMEYLQLADNPLHLSVEDGLLVSGAIAAVWAFAWGFRALALVLQSDGEALEG